MKIINGVLEKALSMPLSSLLLLAVNSGTAACGADISDIASVPTDLTCPKVTEGEPSPGKRVLQVLQTYGNTSIRHALYLPTDWEKGKSYPVIVEYAGNSRTVAGGKSCLGYGISGGKGFIWVCLPYVSEDHSRDADTWWGDVNATVNYCKEAVQLVCKEWGGDSRAVFLAGFSRGSIACNVIGLHDDEIAGLWRGFICHSHYDDGRWQGTDAAGAAERVKRLGRKPQFISNEAPVVEKENIEQYLKRVYPEGQFTFMTLPYRNHTETWVLRDIREREELRDWVNKIMTCNATGVGVLPKDWNPKLAADKVMEGLLRVTPSEVKGAHDSAFVAMNDKAYVVFTANDVRAGEAAAWDFCYTAMSVVNLKTSVVKKFIPFARSGQVYDNESLPTGACFVPRIIRKNDTTLRCFFASEAPGKRQAQTWFMDFHTGQEVFQKNIYRAKIKTSKGVFDMQPRYFYEDAAAYGFTREPKDFGLYTFDFKCYEDEIYVALNNYPGGQNALALLNEGMDTFDVLGHYNGPASVKLTESAVNRLPDGTWLAICRQEEGSRNYMFSQSRDGRQWSAHEYRDIVPNGTSSKPTFDRFNGIYYLGWQENTKISGVNRSVFNIEVSADGIKWERKYRFETVKSFQYPSFFKHDGFIYLSVTQGDNDSSRKERIMFGRLE